VGTAQTHRSMVSVRILEGWAGLPTRCGAERTWHSRVSLADIGLPDVIQLVSVSAKNWRLYHSPATGRRQDLHQRRPDHRRHRRQALRRVRGVRDGHPGTRASSSSPPGSNRTRSPSKVQHEPDDGSGAPARRVARPAAQDPLDGRRSVLPAARAWAGPDHAGPHGDQAEATRP